MPGFSLYKSRFSLIVVGSNDTHWTGYSFVDRDLGENPFEEDDFHYQNDRPHEDPISSDSGFDSIDANVPIWDARAYWLAIGQIRIRKVKQEWEFIIPLLERSIGSYVWNFSRSSMNFGKLANADSILESAEASRHVSTEREDQSSLNGRKSL